MFPSFKIIELQKSQLLGCLALLFIFVNTMKNLRREGVLLLACLVYEMSERSNYMVMFYKLGFLNLLLFFSCCRVLLVRFHYNTLFCSVSDHTVHPDFRGGYLAFTLQVFLVLWSLLLELFMEIYYFPILQITEEIYLTML